MDTPENSNSPIIKFSLFNSIVKGLLTSLTFFFGVHLMGIGFAGWQLGAVFAASMITSLIVILPSGFSNDSFKSKHLITIALLLVATQFIGISQTEKFIPILIFFILGGIGNTLYVASSESLFYKSTKKVDVARKIGIFQSLNYLLIGIGIISAGAILNANITFQTIFFYIGICFAVLALIGHFILPESQTTEFEIIKYKTDIFRPKVILFMAIIFLFAIHYGAENTSYGLFLEKYQGLSRLEMGLYMGLAIGIMTPSVLLISKKHKNFKTKNILIYGLLLSGIGHILMTAKPVELSFAFRVIHEIADSAVFFSIYYVVTQFFNLERIGGNAGIFTFITNIGSAVSALIFGSIGAIYGYEWPLIVSGITLIIAAGLAVQFIHKYKPI